MTTRTVGPSGKDHTTIQAAVVAASNGDTIAIYAGTYTQAGTGPVVDGDTYATGLTIQAMEAGVILDGQSTNCWGIRAGQGWTIQGPGSGVYLTIRDVAASDTTSAGIYGGSSAVTVKDVEIDTSVNRGIYLASSNGLVERVIVHGCGDRAIATGGTLTLHNALVYDCPATSLYMVDVTYQRACTFIFSGASLGCRGQSGSVGCVTVAEAGADPINGIVGATHTYCHVYGAYATGYFSSGSSSTGDVTGSDPATAGFTDAGADDYTLASTSPLRGAGTDLSAYLTVDLLGVTRSAWDVGAYEYVQPPEPSGTPSPTISWWIGDDGAAPGSPDEWDAWPVDPEATLPYLVTATLLTDARAAASDVPGGQSRRGWWGDAVSEPAGSLLWTLPYAPVTEGTAPQAAALATQALQWLIDDDIATDVTVTAEVQGQRLALAVDCRRVTDGERVRVLIPDLWGDYRG